VVGGGQAVSRDDATTPSTPLPQDAQAASFELAELKKVLKQMQFIHTLMLIQVQQKHEINTMASTKM
jgi:hypothetical protein